MTREMKGVPIKSVHWCSSCYQYFGINDVKITINENEKEKEKQGRVDYKHGFDVHAILPPSLFWYDIDKLADWWSKTNYSSATLTESSVKYSKSNGQDANKNKIIVNH